MSVRSEFTSDPRRGHFHRPPKTMHRLGEGGRGGGHREIRITGTGGIFFFLSFFPRNKFPTIFGKYFGKLYTARLSHLNFAEPRLKRELRKKERGIGGGGRKRLRLYSARRQNFAGINSAKIRYRRFTLSYRETPTHTRTHTHTNTFRSTHYNNFSGYIFSGVNREERLRFKSNSKRLIPRLNLY